MANTKTMTSGSPMKLIFFFTMPLIAGNIFQQLYAFVDTLLVGRFLGVEALAAVGCTGCLMFLVVGFTIGMTSGFSIYTGQRFGAKDFEGVRKSSACCMVLSIGVGLILSILGVLLCRWMLELLQTPPEILDGAVSFLSIVYGGIFINTVFLMGTYLIRGLGNSRTPTFLLAIALIFNIILEPIVLLVLEWGIPGAAIAMIASQLFGAVITIIYIWRKVPTLKFTRSDLNIDKNFAYEHLRIGIPMGFQASIIAIGAVILQAALNGLGPVAVAAYSAAQKVDAIALMPMMSFGVAMGAYTAQNYGARKFSRIRKGVKQCIIMSVTFSILVGIFNVFFGGDLVYLFVGEGQQQVVDYGHTFLVVNGMCYFILSLLFIFRYTLQGLGQSVVPTVAGVMELIMRTSAAIFLVNSFGFIGACWANPMSWLGALIPLAIAYCWTVKTFKSKIREERLAVESE